MRMQLVVLCLTCWCLGSLARAAAPTITAFTPTKGPGGQSVTITGKNFTGAKTVRFNGVAAASFTVDSATSVTATLAKGTTTGKIAVTTTGGTATSLAAFTVYQPPTITSFKPTSGSIGTVVTITGKNFTGATAVTFNGTATTVFSVASATSIAATVPSGATSGRISVITPGGTATSAANFTVYQPPTIADFTPTGGIVGQQVTITGTGFAGATAVKFNGKASTTFIVGSATVITAIVPSGATTGPISVTTAGGTAMSAGNFTVYQPPTITSFTPPSGVFGQLVSIIGTNFIGATAVKFNGVDAASFTVLNATTILAIVPNGATTGKISVTTPGGTATRATLFTVYQPPTITTFTPTSGPFGTVVTITGTYFSDVSAVKFNGMAAATFSVRSVTSIIATVPNGASTGRITITTLGGTATSASDFTVYQPPTITTFTPTSGPFGQEVTITGAYLTGATSVKINGLPVAYTVVSATSITATVPSGATTGKITITTPGGTAISAANLTVYQPPTITAFTPKSGPLGQVVTITGTYLTGATSVQFNGVDAATFTVLGASSISATLPMEVTSGQLSVTTPGGTATSAGELTVYQPPTITDFTPTSGPLGQVVTITGTYFTEASAVKFNGTPALDFTVDSETSITATVPSGATTGPLTVTTPGGTATSTDDLTVYQPPTITAYTPKSGPLGQVVTITGTYLTGATEVTFNGTPALGFTVDSDTAITTTVPSGATTGKIAVTTDGGTATSVATFTVYQPPTIVSFTPTLGPVGRVVLLTGTNFTGATAVTFNGTPAKTFGVGSATSMSAIVPSGATTGPIAVTTPGGIAVSTEDFTVYAPPTIISFTPNKGPVGQTVTITGTNFTGTTSVKFNGAASIWFTVVSAKSITARVPSGASTGRITVTTPGGTATSVAEFSVTGVTSTNATDGAAMVWVPAGTFPMGSIGGVGDANERPVHSVSHDGYWIYKYEVTVAQYRAFCTATSRALPPFPSGKSWTGKTGWGDPALQQHPIVNVTWDDASAYAEWARVQLPTEAQWEYAARGARGNNYPWGGTATELDQYNGCDWTKCANAYNSFPLGKSTWPVGSFPLGASWCGAQDMAGNVWEWCADWYDEYTSVPLYNPSGPLDGVSHVLRGGSWKDNAEYYCRTAHRESLYYLDSSKDNYGFRCVYAPNYYFDY